MTSDLKFKWWPLQLCCSTSVGPPFGYIASAIIASISHLFIRYTITINLNLGAITSITNQFSLYLHRCITYKCLCVCIGLQIYVYVENKQQKIKSRIHTNKLRYYTYIHNSTKKSTVEWFLLKHFLFSFFSSFRKQ